MLQNYPRSVGRLGRLGGFPVGCWGAGSRDFADLQRFKPNKSALAQSSSARNVSWVTSPLRQPSGRENPAPRT